jgi:hypothetical protein
MSDPVTPTTEPQPLNPEPLVLAINRLIADRDAERARAEQAERSKAALVAKVKRLEDRCAVLRGALPAGDVREGWAKAIARAEQAEAPAFSVIRKAAGSPMWWARLDRRTNMGWTDDEWAVIRRALDASPTEVCTACGDRGRPECADDNCDVPADASPTEGNPDAD